MAKMSRSPKEVLCDKIDEAVQLKAEIASKKNKLDQLSAEIQEHGLRMIEDRDIKQITLTTTTGNYASVTKPVTVELRNYDRLVALLGETMVKKNVKLSTTVDYKPNTDFSAMFANIVLGTYIRNQSLSEFIAEAFPNLDSKVVSALLKKLKGKYASDKKALAAALGLETLTDEYDVELYHISLIKNWELIKAFLPADSIDEAMKVIKDIVTASEGLKIEYGGLLLEE